MRGHGLRMLERAATAEIAVIPVTRNVWFPIGAMMPAAAARRRIMVHAADWFIGSAVIVFALWPGLVRNGQPLRSSAVPAAAM